MADSYTIQVEICINAKQLLLTGIFAIVWWFELIERPIALGAFQSWLREHLLISRSIRLTVLFFFR